MLSGDNKMIIQSPKYPRTECNPDKTPQYNFTKKSGNDCESYEKLK